MAKQTTARPSPDGAAKQTVKPKHLLDGADGRLPAKKAVKAKRPVDGVDGRSPAPEHYHLRLYIAGQTRKSLQAVANLRQICDKYLAGRYSIEVIDLLDQPQLARTDQILAIPTLVRKLPPPVKKIIGDLSRTEKVLLGLDVETHPIPG